MPSLISTLMRVLAAIHFALKAPEFRSLLILVVLMLPTGVIFYSSVEGWAPLDALCYSVMTLTTVGGGPLHPVTGLGKTFTMIYAFGGIGLFTNLMLGVGRASLPSGRPGGKSIASRVREVSTR